MITHVPLVVFFGMIKTFRITPRESIFSGRALMLTFVVTLPTMRFAFFHILDELFVW